MGDPNAVNTGSANVVGWRDYMEALAIERARATDMASEEREKAAAALRLEMARSVSEGDARLREYIEASDIRLREFIVSTSDRLHEHIGNQIGQIREALNSAERLELTRIEALREQTNLVAAASKEAILKAETATEARFASVNEFRAQLADQSALYIPRETAEARLDSLAHSIEQRAGANAAKITELEKRMNLAQGAVTGTRAILGYAVGAVGVVVAIATLILR